MSRRSKERWHARKKASMTLNCKPQVFKMQRPLMQMGEGPLLVLAYNENRSVSVQFPMSKDCQKLFGGQHKIFVMAHVVNDEFQWGEKVPDPGW